MSPVLNWGKKLLETYDRVIWIDADVYICNPSSFLVDLPPCKFLFCHEHWVHTEGQTIHVAERVNNAEVGMLSPILLDAAKQNDREFLDTCLKRRNGFPLHAANLCLTFFNAIYEGRRLDDEAYETAMDYLDTLSR